MKQFKYVSLFSGMGGFETALNRLGGACVLSSEIDKYANRAYQILYGHQTAGDVTKINAEDVPDHDVLVGGFPCQAFSIAGKRLGFEDTRGTLFFEIARIAKAKKPKLLLLENVKGLLNHDKGNTMETIVQTISDLGYAVDFSVINSKFFDVPQNRERVMIVCSLTAETEPWMAAGTDMVSKAKRRIAALDVRTFNFSWPVNGSVTTRLRDVLETDVDEKYFLADFKTAKLLADLNSRTVEPQGQGSDKPRMIGSLEHYGNDQMNRVYDVNAIGPTITVVSGGGREQKIAVLNNDSYRIRTLTPIECFRLQGFPDSYYQKLKANGLSNSQLYKMAGNAVTVNVVEAIGRNLFN